MKKLSALLLLICISCAHIVVAQCSPAPRATGTTFAYGVTDSVTPSQPAPQPYIVCDNASLFYYGNDPDTVYLEGSARLYVQTCFNLVVYMRNNSQLRCDSLAFLRTFRDIIYDPTFTTFVDTSGSVFQHFASCPAMSYNYMHFPSGASPCGAATAVGSASPTATWLAYPNPTHGTLHLRLPADWQGRVQATLYGLDGRSIQTSTVVGPQPEIGLENMPAGNYLLRLSHGGKMLSRIVTVE